MDSWDRTRIRAPATSAAAGEQKCSARRVARKDGAQHLGRSQPWLMVAAGLSCCSRVDWLTPSVPRHRPEGDDVERTKFRELLLGSLLGGLLSGLLGRLRRSLLGGLCSLSHSYTPKTWKVRQFDKTYSIGTSRGAIESVVRLSCSSLRGESFSRSAAREKMIDNLSTNVNVAQLKQLYLFLVKRIFCKCVHERRAATRASPLTRTSAASS